MTDFPCKQMATTDKYRNEFERIFNQSEKGPYGCKCQTLSQNMVGDGCDECNPELAAEIEKDNMEWPDE